MSSGVKRTPDIMKELLEKYGRDITGDQLESRFDVLWRRISDQNREMMLEGYLDARPSTGYMKLAALVREGYFDLVLTFNFDNLLESALHAANVDTRSIIRGETEEQAMARMLDSGEPRCKILKLHGSLKSSQYFLFSNDELLKYPAPTEALISRLTSGDIIVCGYAFQDPCVTRAFADEGGTVVCVNPTGAPRQLDAFLWQRRSTDWVIPTTFDGFFDHLHELLLAPRTLVTAERPAFNPFKFLESHEESDSDIFTGRDQEAKDFFDLFTGPPLPQVVVVAGPEKAGKTSFVNAALLAKLDPERFLGVYARCKLDWAQSLPREIDNLLTLNSNEVSLVGVLRSIGDHPDRHVVLFLDEFDRVIGDHTWANKAGRQALGDFLKSELFPGCHDGLTIILIVTDVDSLGGWLYQACMQATQHAGLVLCQAMEGPEVAKIIRELAARAELEFDPRIITEMVQRYDTTRASSTPFTLAHIQAVCHLLASKRHVEYESFKAFDTNLGALHQAINVADIMSFVEDFSWPETVWLRNMIKVPLRESKELIAAFIKKHYGELVPNRDAQATGGRSRAQRVG